MKDLILGMLAAAAGIYAEKKYNVSERLTELVRSATNKEKRSRFGSGETDLD